MATAEPIQLDLRRDLAKVRAAYDAGKLKLGVCYYSAPCAVGAMMTPEQRRSLPRCHDGIFIGALFADGLVSAPPEQRSDFDHLQMAFDDGQPISFAAMLTALEAKYAPEQAA